VVARDSDDLFESPVLRVSGAGNLSGELEGQTLGDLRDEILAGNIYLNLLDHLWHSRGYPAQLGATLHQQYIQPFPRPGDANTRTPPHRHVQAYHFEVRQGRVFGLQVDDDGTLSSRASYAYRFNLQEMKSPLMEAVTRAGWVWRPVLWGGAPSWMKCLTE
jgi:hypothetical protein